MPAVSQAFTIVNKTGREIELPYCEGDNPRIPAGATVTRSLLLSTHKGRRHGLFDGQPDRADGTNEALSLFTDLIDGGVITCTPDPRALAGVSPASLVAESPVGAGDVRLVGGGSSGSNFLVDGANFSGTAAENALEAPDGASIAPDSATTTQLTIAKTKFSQRTLRGLGSKIPAVQGSVTRQSALTITERVPADGAQIVLLDPAAPSQALSISVSTDLRTVTVSLATNGSSVLTTTAQQAADAINADATAKNIFDAKVETGQGATVLTAVAATSMSGGLKEGTPKTVYKAGMFRVARKGSTVMNSGAANSDVTLVEKTAGQAPSCTFVNPGQSASLAVAVSGKDITVTLAHNGSALTSTATQVTDAINNDASASALVTATAEGSGAGTVDAIAKQSITNGGKSPHLFIDPNKL